MTDADPEWYARYRRRAERKRLLRIYGDWLSMAQLPPELRTKSMLRARVKRAMEQAQ